MNENIDFAVKQYKLMGNSLAAKPGEFPKTADKNGGLVTCNSSWWTTGFWPGSLCFLYSETHDDSLKIQAETYLSELAKYQFVLDNHDIGWIVNSSFVNWYRLAGNEQYGKIIVQTAKSMITRFNPIVGCIRTWDVSEHRKGSDFLVNIDNMLNLELLMEAFKISKDSTFLKIAIQHADNTLKNQFRPDNSSYHVVDYDSTTGEVRRKETGQGFSDDSAWSRGQAWGLYGFTMMYRETGELRYLKQAENIAEFIVNHSLGALPENSEVDVPLIYADYYYLEALLRYKKLVLSGSCQH